MSAAGEPWAVLMKFGQRRHLEAFREGLLYMNPQAFFAKIEEDGVRRDPFEATDQIHQPRDIERITISAAVDASGTRREIVIAPEDMAGPVSIQLSTTQRYNLFCMYGLREPLPFVDERCLAFGDSFVLVLNTNAFLERVSKALAAASLNGEYCFVEHYDANAHSGETGVFRKPSSFDYQREFRIAVSPGCDEALEVRVGDLTDITSPALPLAEINKIVDFSEAAAGLADLV